MFLLIELLGQRSCTLWGLMRKNTSLEDPGPFFVLNLALTGPSPGACPTPEIDVSISL